MSERLLPFSINEALLPEGTTISLQGIESGAIQSFVLDGAYRIAAFDPAVQTPEVRERYREYPPARMAAVLLGGVGCLEAFREAESTAEGSQEARVAKPYADRLRASDPFCAREMINCFNTGLLRADYIPGSLESLPQLTLDEVTVLRAIDSDSISETVQAKWLPLLVKAYALRYLQPKKPDEAIRHLAPKVKSYNYDHRLGVVFKEVQDTFDDVDFRPARSLSLDEQSLAEHEAFIDSLASGQIDLTGPGPHSIAWRGSILHFDFRDQLSENRALTLMLHLCGVTRPEISKLLGCTNMATTQRMNDLHHALGIDGQTDVTLFAIEQGYLSFEGSAQLRDPKLANTSLKLLRMLSEQARSLSAISQDFSAPSTAMAHLKAMSRRIYNDMGVTSLREAVLAAMTHRLLQPAYREIETYPSLQEVLLSDLCMYPGRRIVMINGAKVTLNFGNELTREEGAAATLMTFGIPAEAIMNHARAAGSSVGTMKTLANARETLGIQGFDRAKFLPAVIKKYATDIDLSEYQAPDHTLSEQDKQLLLQLTQKSRAEIAQDLEISSWTVENRIKSLRRKFGADNDTVMMWEAYFCGHLLIE